MRKNLTLTDLNELFEKLMPFKGRLGMDRTKIFVRVNHENHQVYQDQCLFQSRPKAVDNKEFLLTNIEQNIIIDMDSCNFLVDSFDEDNYTNINNIDEKSSLGDITLLSKDDNNYLTNKVKIDPNLMVNKDKEKQETISFSRLTDIQKEQIYMELCDYLGFDDISVSIIKTDKGVELKIDDPCYKP